MTQAVQEKFTSLALDGDGLIIAAGNDYRLERFDTKIDNFPAMACGDPVYAVDLPKAAFSTPAYAMSHEETRYYLNGLYIHSARGRLKTVATDGHRLCVHDTGIDAKFEGAIIPRKTVNLVNKIAGDHSSAAMDISIVSSTSPIEKAVR